jgi:hypothetical protein
MNERYAHPIHLGMAQRPVQQPDRDGYNWWLNELYSGDRSAPEVMLEFTQSDEYVNASLQIVGLQLWLT